MVAADVDLAEAVLHHPGGAQQDLVERGVFALGGVLDGGLAEVVSGGAEAGQDGAALAVEPLGDDVEVDRGLVGCALSCRRSCRCNGCSKNQTQSTDPPSHRTLSLSQVV